MKQTYKTLRGQAIKQKKPEDQFDEKLAQE
jgi:hypothetical protein